MYRVIAPLNPHTHGFNLMFPFRDHDLLKQPAHVQHMSLPANRVNEASSAIVHVQNSSQSFRDHGHVRFATPACAIMPLMLLLTGMYRESDDALTYYYS